MKQFNLDDAELFLTTLFSKINEGFLELRPVRETTVNRRFFSLSEDQDLSQPLNYAQSHAGQYHIFLGIQPRIRKSGKDQDVSHLITFWVDMDGKDFDGGKSEALEKIRNFDLDPTIIVDSGNGFHVYWVLENPIEVTNRNCEELTLYSKALHIELEADSTHNISRLLRLPGTPNIKNPHDPTGLKVVDDPALWKTCSVKTINNNYYTLNDFDEILDFEQAKEEIFKTTIDIDKDVDILNLDDLKDRISNRILKRASSAPDKFEGDRSRNDFWLAINLYKEGLNDAEVYRAFEIFAKNNWIGGDKFKEKGAKYLLTYVLPSAKKVYIREEQDDSLEGLLRKVEEAPDYKKDERAEPIYEKIVNLPPKRKEMTIKRLQQALGGIPLKTIRRKLHQVEKEDDGGTSKFFTFTSTGSEKFVPKKLAEYLLEQDSYMYLNGVLYRYEDGVFNTGAEPYLKNKIREELDYRWAKKYRDDTITWIKDMTYEDLDMLPSNNNLVNVKNGMLDIKTKELKPHNEKYKSIIQFPVNYNPDAYNERLDRFIEEVFPSDTIPLLWEHCGYILLDDLELKKFLILVGNSNSGKSKFLELIEEVVGEDNVSHESLHRLTGRPFSIANLFGKVANIYSDLESSALKNTGIIKMLTGGDKIHAEIKHGDTFYFQNRARFFFSANTLPRINSDDAVFFNRIHVVRCPNQFIPGENADPFILQKLNTDEGKSYWLNRAVKGAQRLLDNQKFTTVQSVEDEISSYRNQSDSVSEFIDSQTVVERGSWEEKSVIYTAYRNWCHDVGRKPVSFRKFIRRSQQPPHNFVEFHPKDKKKGKQVNAWRNIRLTDMCEQKYETQNFNVDLK